MATISQINGMNVTDTGSVRFDEEQTLTDEQKLQARKNISAAAEEQALKSMYNLGAYDTFTDNGDGTATITRKTGYLYLDGSDDETYSVWGTDGAFTLDRRNTNFVGVDYQQKSHAVANVLVLSREAQDGSTQKCVSMAQMAEQTKSGRFLFIKTVDSSLTTVDLFRSYLSNAPIYVQYETQTSYTEEVILDQPIHTLDVNGEQFVRDEWEKGLNILNVNGGSGASGGWTWTWDAENQAYVFNGSGLADNVYLSTPLSDIPAGTYTAVAKVISGNCANSYIRFGFGNSEAGKYTLQDCPSSAGEAHITASFSGNGNDFCILSPIRNAQNAVATNYKVCFALYKGDHAYPYQPYNGKIVHESRVPLYFSDNNTSPASIFGGDWTSLGSFSSGGNTIYVWKKA